MSVSMWDMPEPRLDPPEEQELRRCPECGEELNFDDKVYVNCAGRVVGCQHCLEERDAEDAVA